MKGIITHKQATPYGGIIPILKAFKDFNIDKTITKTLGNRKGNRVEYSYANIFIAWTAATLCGSERLNHITGLKRKLPMPDIKLPSHDTLGRVLKGLSAEVKTFETVSHRKKEKTKITTTEYDDNVLLNKMLVRCTKDIGALKEGPYYKLDIDQTFIPTQCRGARRNLKPNGTIDYTRLGFSPLVCLIGDLPVFISNRNGDAGASFRLSESLENCLNLLDESKIRIGRVVSDAAGYNLKTMTMLDNRGIKFNIRFRYNKKMHAFNEKLSNCKSWKKTEIKTANHVWDCEVADIPHTMYETNYKNGRTFRIVAVRITNHIHKNILQREEYERRKAIKEKLKTLSRKKVLKEMGKAYEDKNWKEIGSYQYKFYATNDDDRSGEEIVYEYNKRGDAERKFSFMKNDYAWKLPPFMNMNENTCFLIAAALANNLYRGVAIHFKKKLPEIRLNARLRDFIRNFVMVICEYIGNEVYTFDNPFYDYPALLE